VSIDGNYDNYLEFKENNQKPVEKEIKETTKVNIYKLQKEQQALERKRNSRISKIEKEIEEKEADLEELQRLLELPETSADYEKLLELTENFDLLKNKLDDLYLEWEEIQA
jgi:ATP-binding cassette subfamily F protein 3